MSNLSIRFDRMYERDRQTDRQTPHDGKGNKSSAVAERLRVLRVCLFSQLQHTYIAVFYYQLLRLQIYLCIKFY